MSDGADAPPKIVASLRLVYALAVSERRTSAPDDHARVRREFWFAWATACYVSVLFAAAAFAGARCDDVDLRRERESVEGATS